MLRIFEGSQTEGDGWGGKTNFVDDNNVLLGWDSGQACCENAGWFIATEVNHGRYDEPVGEVKVEDGQAKQLLLSGHVFDPTFHVHADVTGLDAGDCVVFRLIGFDNEPDLFLHLYNAHNGYYSHGFTFGVPGEQPIYGGSL